MGGSPLPAERPAGPLEPRWGYSSCLTFIGRTYELLGERIKAAAIRCRYCGEDLKSTGSRRIGQRRLLSQRSQGHLFVLVRGSGDDNRFDFFVEQFRGEQHLHFRRQGIRSKKQQTQQQADRGLTAQRPILKVDQHSQRHDSQAQKHHSAIPSREHRQCRENLVKHQKHRGAQKSKLRSQEPARVVHQQQSRHQHGDHQRHDE